ncbi:GH25 family lysozyme [Streptomyces sp. NBC_00079]|uniref:GH25 family lysozyme n=1 Tax=Streptomyces sp. NBC_00079 TaxID=2975644 RepID=UPI0032499951
MSESVVGVSWWRRRCVAVVAAVVSGGVLAVVPVVPAGAVTAGGLGSAETLRSNASVRGSGTVNDRLRPGERLTAGQSLAPANGENQLVMQGDGNLVLLSLGHPVWGSGTEGHPGASATMQGDGNLVINDAGGKALWGSGTDGHPGASATMQGDGNFVVNDTHGKALWASRTINNSLHPTSKLGSGQELRSVSEQYKLVMQGDGNLVEYNAGGKALWGSGTQGHPGASATMQGDGNLVINDANGKALWGSGTEGHPGAWINLQDDGNLVIYQNGKALWGNAANNPADSAVPGLDVGASQGNVDWNAVRADGYRFAYVSAADGTSQNPFFRSQYDGAKAAGLFRGAYFFAEPVFETGKTHADWLLDQIGYTRDGKTLPPVLDVERNERQPRCDGVSSSTWRAYVRDFTGEVKRRTGVDAVIYASPAFWHECLDDDGEFSKSNPLWVANYGVNKPAIPGGWPTYTFWQYASNGSVPGVSGEVDLDTFNGGMDGLQRLSPTG